MRSYGQFCGLAFGLDIIGDRWNLLIVRNLILGPQRWKEMRHNLPGVAKNLLSSRLKDLEEAGVVYAENDSYVLSEKGRELEDIVFAIAEWGEKYFLSSGDEYQKRPRFFYTSLRRKLKPSVKEGLVHLKVGADSLKIKLGPEPLLEQMNEDEVLEGATHFSTDFPTMAELVFGDGDWKRMEKDGRVSVTGSRRGATMMFKVLGS